MIEKLSLQRLSAADLDGLIKELEQSGAKSLILLGPGVKIPITTDQWPDFWLTLPVVYYLNESVPDLAQRLSTLTQLTSLSLSGNQIGDDGAASLATLVRLSFLDLSRNCIDNVGASSLSALSGLTYLNLSYNLIGFTGAASIATLSELSTLILGYNGIGDHGAASLRALSKLTSLDLSYNAISITGAASLASLSLINTLKLEGNQIGSTGAAALAALTQLTFLDLAHNRIDDEGADSLASLTHLTSLILKGNQIGDVGAGSLAALTQLTYLDLEYNQIGDDGTASLAALNRLTSLKLMRNKIDDASPLSSLSQLGCLTIVGGNSLSCLPPELIVKGNSAILDYLLDIGIQGLDYIYEAKVLILGEGGVGKTSLLRRLYRQDLNLPQAEESTKGIDIYLHQFAISERKSFCLNVWDFGGQQIYHATHQFFLTKRSLYILVDDTRNNSKSVHDEGFKYWLEVIEALSGSCPVFIFQNERSNRSKEIDQSGIKGRFPNVIEVFCGNLEEQGSANTLEAAIRLKARQLPHVGDPVPAQWVAIRSDLERIKKVKPYISQNDFFQIYGKYLKLEYQNALLLSEYFHDLGVFLHFQEDPLLSRVVILQNDWATEAVFKILDDEPTKAKKGYFNRTSCRRIWADSIYFNMHLELISLMERFELCYKLPDQKPETWLAPQLLSLSIPDEFKNWADAEDLMLTYQFNFLPKGMISRLMVRMHRFVRDPDRSWASGAYFEHGQTKLLASISSSTGQEIELRARGPDRKNLLNVIASDLDALISSFEGLRHKVLKLVPCICRQCLSTTKPYRFDEPTLLRARWSSIISLPCNFSFEEVSILRLLDGLNLEATSEWAKSDVKKFRSVDPSQSGGGYQRRGDANLRLIRVFLASSSELIEHRDGFELYFRQENDRLRTQGFYLEVNRWENSLDAMSETRLQDEYNKAIGNCDIFVSLFKTKTGKYTEEEFNVAHSTFKATGKPLIYTYFMRTEVPNDRSLRGALTSLWDFQDTLSKLGHFHTEYTSIQDLQNQFRRQLDKVIDEEML